MFLFVRDCTYILWVDGSKIRIHRRTTVGLFGRYNWIYYLRKTDETEPSDSRTLSKSYLYYTIAIMKRSVCRT